MKNTRRKTLIEAVNTDSGMILFVEVIGLVSPNNLRGNFNIFETRGLIFYKL